MKDEFHDANMDTCYISQPNQNTTLARALNNQKIISLLKHSSAWEIANGWPEKPLNKWLRTYNEFPKECAVRGN